jgi:hypothetical protein
MGITAGRFRGRLAFLSAAALIAIPNLLSPPRASAYSVPVPSKLSLTVRETAGVARNAEVVHSGVPMARSLGLRDTSRLAIVDASGQAVPAEFEITARWNAGLSDTTAPIQWMLVTFPATVAAGGSASYRLVLDGSVANPAPARPLRLTQSGDDITVDTGAAVFRFGADPSALFEEITLANGTRLVGGGQLTMQANGTPAGHPATRRIRIEHAGPLFAAVVIQGAYDLPAIGNGGAGSIRRYVFTAGSPTAIVRHAVSWEGNLACNGCTKLPDGSPNGLLVEQVRDTLGLQLGGTPTVTAVGAFASPAVTGPVAAGQTASVRQLLRNARTEALHFDVNVAGSAASGIKADGGMLAASGPAGAVAIALSHMHRYEPEALRLLADGSLAVDVADGTAWLAHHQGMFATMAVSALGSAPSRAQLDQSVWGPLNRPLRAWPDAAWFASSDAVDEFPVGPLPADLASYDTLIPAVLDRTLSQIDQLGLAGLMTYGVFPRYWGKDGAEGEIDCATGADPTPGATWDDKFWCTSWTDYHNTASTVPIWAMRTGQVEWLDEIAVPAALRMLHTEVMQCSPTEKWFYCGQAPAGYGGYRADFNSSHAYLENEYLYYWLTGDSTVIDALRRGGENMRRMMCDTRGPRPVAEPLTGPGGPACDPDHVSTTAEFTGRVASQWISTFRFLGLASPDGTFLEDFRSSLARAATQFYVEADQNGVAYGFLGERAVTPGTYIDGPMWMHGFYDTNNLYRLLRDTGDAPIGNPALPPSRIMTTIAHTLRDLEPAVTGDGTVAGDWPKNLQYTWSGTRIGASLDAVGPDDRPIFTPEKTSVTALFLRAGELSNEPALLSKGVDMVHFTLAAAIGEGAPLGKLEGQYLTRLHAAVGELTNPTGSVPLPQPPAAPAALTAQTVSSTEILLAWTDNSTNEASFRIERLINGTFQEVQVTAANVTAAHITGLAAGTSYSFRVRASNADGSSAYTDTASATTTPAALPPAAPTGLTAAALSGTEILLAWTDKSDNELSFRVEQQINGSFQEIQTTAANATSAHVTGLTAGATYSFRVRAANATGFSAYTGTATATTPGTSSGPLNPPTNLTASATSTTAIQLAWSDNSTNESSFLIEKLVNGVFTQFKTVGANITTTSVSGLTPGALYTFRVRAATSTDKSAYSNTASATTPTSLLTAPTGLRVTIVSNTTVDLTWLDTSQGESEFRIERRLGYGAFGEIRQVGANVVTTRISGLTPGQAYGFRVRATTSTLSSQYSNIGQVTMPK